MRLGAAGSPKPRAPRQRWIAGAAPQCRGCQDLGFGKGEARHAGHAQKAKVPTLLGSLRKHRIRVIQSRASAFMGQNLELGPFQG